LVPSIVHFYAQIIRFPVDRGLYRALAPALWRQLASAVIENEPVMLRARLPHRDHLVRVLARAGKDSGEQQPGLRRDDDALFAGPAGRVDADGGADDVRQIFQPDPAGSDRTAPPQRVLDLVEDAAVQLLLTEVGARVGVFEHVADVLREVRVVVHGRRGGGDAWDLALHEALQQGLGLGRGGCDPVWARSGAQAEAELVEGVLHVPPCGKFLQPGNACISPSAEPFDIFRTIRPVQLGLAAVGPADDGAACRGDRAHGGGVMGFDAGRAGHAGGDGVALGGRDDAHPVRHRPGEARGAGDVAGDVLGAGVGFSGST
jgi:hypothetical protein